MNFTSADTKSEYIWVNGEFIDKKQAKIHMLTHGLHYSGAVFEGERAYNGKVFKLMEHTNRLLKSAEYMHLKIRYSAEEINSATNMLLKKNNLLHAYIRPLIWRGDESLEVYNQNLKCNILIMAQESNPQFKRGLKLYITPWCKVGADAMPPQCKSSTHYGMMIVSQKIAQDMGYDDALIMDQYGDIAECSTANIFFAKGDILITPVADRFLNGITRQTVIEMAKDIGIRVREERLTMEDVRACDACFLTGTSAEIKGVSSITFDHQKLEFNNDAIVVKLQNEYAKIVGKTL